MVGASITGVCGRTRKSVFFFSSRRRHTRYWRDWSSDVCSSDLWPFDDAQFDFVVCSHVLEDIRDPLFVCSELQRVAKAGYIEVPSRLEEQSKGVQGDWVGWSHHHWIIELNDDRLDFLFKPHMLHTRDEFSFPPEFHQALNAEERVERLWWTGS